MFNTTIFLHRRRPRSKEALDALGRARETFGLAELSLPPPPVEPSRADAEDDDADAQPERRRCQQCNRDRPEGAFAPVHWAGTNRGGGNRRRCLSCAPHTTPNGQRFCSQCERSKNTREFGPNVNGRVQRVCRTCTSTQERLTFFVENSPRLSEYLVS